MGKVIKAQLFQLKKNRLVIFMFAAISVIMFLQVFLVAYLGDDKAMNAGCHYFVNFCGLLQMMAVVFITVSAAVICSDDFMDRTINYEIMSGQPRKNVYFGRALTALAVGTAGGAFLYLMPLITDTVAFGWGTKMTPGAAALRIALILLALARFCCDMILLNFAAKNPYVMMFAGYLLLVAGISGGPAKFPYALAFSNIAMLNSFDTYVTFSLEDATFYVYDASLTAAQIIGSAASSLFFGAAEIFIGYFYFRKDDLN